MMWLLYVTLAAVVVVGFSGMVWLRRLGDRLWEADRRRRREAELLEPIRQAFIRVQIQVVDLMTPALQEMGRAVARLAPELERFAAAYQAPPHPNFEAFKQRALKNPDVRRAYIAARIRNRRGGL